MAQLEIRECLAAQLALIPAVVAIVGDRIYPAKKKQDALFPHIIYWRAHEKRVKCFKGADGNAEAVFMIDCWALTPDEAVALARAVRGKGTNTSDPTLDCFQGWFGGAQGTGVLVQNGDIEDLGEDTDKVHDNRPQQGDDVGVYRETLAFEVFYNEP